MADADRKSAKPRRDFYAGALDADEQELFWKALQIDGIDEEVAVLRYALRKEFANKPGTYDMLSENAARLVRAVAVQYRMSPKSKEDFAEHVMTVLRDLGDQFSGAGDV
jgi:hypothetical protein